MTNLMRLKQLSMPDFLSYLISIRKLSPDGDEWKRAIYVYCEHNKRAFAEILFPHYCTEAFNEFHLEYFQSHKPGQRGLRDAWVAPRGAAKSTVVTLVGCLHDHAYAVENFVLVISNTDDQANQKVKDIRNEVLSNSLYREVYGAHFKTRSPPETDFVIYGPGHVTKVMAAGTGKQIRGIRFGPYRPSKIVLDDYEHSERVYSEKQREKTSRHFLEDVGKVGNEKTNIEIVGTILHPRSLLKSLMTNPSYRSWKFKSIKKWPTRNDLWDQWERIYMDIQNPDRQDHAQAFYDANAVEMNRGAEVLWPEKEPLLYLMKERLEIGKRAFSKEKQNEPMSEDEKLFDRMHWYRVVKGHIEIESTGELIPMEHLRFSAYGAMDPATGQNKASKARSPDFAAMAMGYHDPKGRLLVHEDWMARKSPTKQIEAIFDSHERLEFQKFAVETNLYRNLLLPNIIAERKRREAEKRQVIKIPFYDVENTENKDRRIHRLEPKVSHGWILFNRALSQEAQNQMDDYPFGDHDDFPDAVEMLYNLVNNRYKVAAESLSATSGR